jgi:hypothetical protein
VARGCWCRIGLEPLITLLLNFVGCFNEKKLINVGGVVTSWREGIEILLPLELDLATKR